MLCLAMLWGAPAVTDVLSPELPVLGTAPVPDTVAQISPAGHTGAQGTGAWLWMCC